MAELVHNWAVETGIPQHQISAEEIVDRCIYTPTTTDLDFPDYKVCLGAEFADQRRKP